MKIFCRLLRAVGYVVFPLAFLIISFFMVLQLATEPSNNRNWNDDQAVLPYADINGDLVYVHNIRNFTYATTTEYVKGYYDKTFNLKDIRHVWYVVEPFSGIPGSAHTFLSFEFADNQFVSVSVEIRKEKGESFHPVKGLLNQYELMYVVADERDVVKLRSNYRQDLVYVYPMKADTEKVQKLFIDMMNRVNQLQVHPEFYNTLTNTCTTNIVHHVNSISPHRVPLYNLQVLFPANSDRLAYELGLIDTTLSFEEARKRFFINEKALKYADSPDFSVKIRAEK